MPKCGSSALQTALSRTPILTHKSGQEYRYTASWVRRFGLRKTISGNDITRHAIKSPYGYSSWTSLAPMAPIAPAVAALRKIQRNGRENGFVPIASSESWVGRPEFFENALKELGSPRVTVIAFVRPVADWINAAYWQWTIWRTPSLDHWVNRACIIYQFGLKLEAWSKIPNVDLRICGQSQDVVATFGKQLGLDIPSGPRSNATASPALLGFQLRNRSFRKTPNDSEFEFIVQRWCPAPVNAKRTWALRPKHLRALRNCVTETRNALERIMDTDAFAELMEDPRWTKETPYHAALSNGPSDLNDPSDARALLISLRAGVEAAGGALDALPVPETSATLDQLDACLTQTANRLIKADQRYRRKESMQLGWA